MGGSHPSCQATHYFELLLVYNPELAFICMASMLLAPTLCLLAISKLIKSCDRTKAHSFSSLASDSVRSIFSFFFFCLLTNNIHNNDSVYIFTRLLSSDRNELRVFYQTPTCRFL